MSRIKVLKKQIADLQAELGILTTFPEDTYPLGTVAVFASGVGGHNKTYYKKIEEETWANIATNEEKDLASWILFTRQSDIGYFEVYILTPAASPIYASA